MNASDLLLISTENEISIEQILKTCENNAKNGQVECVFYMHFSIETICELAKNGFNVRNTKGPMGENSYIVSWNNI
jgi:hypothetical protein